MSTTSSERTVKVLRSLFARYGLPRVIASDNGTQFTSGTFQLFCKNNGIQHKLSAPYHPSTNGEVERFVHTFKTAMKATHSNLQVALCQFLMRYRSTPHTVTGKTPAAMMFSREITTRLSLLLPKRDSQHATEQHVKNEQVRSFKCGDLVWVRQYSGHAKWSPGQVVEICGPRNYLVSMGQSKRKCHVDQLRYRHMELPATVTNSTMNFDDFPSPPQPVVTNNTGRYPTRTTRRPPDRLTY